MSLAAVLQYFAANSLLMKSAESMAHSTHQSCLAFQPLWIHTYSTHQAPLSPVRPLWSKSNHHSSCRYFTQETFLLLLLHDPDQEKLKSNHTRISTWQRKRPTEPLDQHTLGHHHVPQHGCPATDETTSKDGDNKSEVQLNDRLSRLRLASKSISRPVHSLVNFTHQKTPRTWDLWRAARYNRPGDLAIKDIQQKYAAVSRPLFFSPRTRGQQVLVCSHWWCVCWSTKVSSFSLGQFLSHKFALHFRAPPSHPCSHPPNAHRQTCLLHLLQLRPEHDDKLNVPVRLGSMDSPLTSEKRMDSTICSSSIQINGYLASPMDLLHEHAVNERVTEMMPIDIEATLANQFICSPAVCVHLHRVGVDRKIS